jgi:uncharacterized protein (TIGR03083 family)
MARILDSSTYFQRVGALAETWRQWAEIAEGLQPGEWAAPSRCQGWDVACLYAHHSLFPLGLSRSIQPASDQFGDKAVLTAAEILRRFNVSEGAAHTMAEAVAGRARDDARRLSPEELTRRFSSVANQAVNALRNAAPDMLVTWPRTDGVVPLHEAVRIVLLESVVHLLDVLGALGREPAMDEDALREVAALLAELASPVEFIEAATGRSPTSPLPVLR